MKKLFTIAALIAGTMTLVSCGDDEDPIPVDDNVKGTAVSENITSDVTWTTGSQYTLTGRISVESGATLTIEPGVIIYGQAGTGANATALVIAQGATLNAQGTAASPIIMTSIADEIEPGEINSPNLSEDLDGLWGGLIVLGNARISISGDAEATNIEGIPSTDANGLYGGTDDTDNSGTITYVSVRHGGSNIGEGNEINGITFGGVGSGTTVNHIEIVANQDDGVEFFGGTVNVNDVLVWNNGDDAIDTDQAYAGTVDNFIIINAGDKGFELDGPEGTYAGAGHTITNGTVYMQGTAGGYDDDDNTDAFVSNVYFTDFTEDTGTSNDYNVNGNYVATNLQMDDTDADANAITIAQYFADMDGLGAMTVVTTPTVGATASEFTGWTLADLRNAF